MPNFVLFWRLICSFVFYPPNRELFVDFFQNLPVGHDALFFTQLKTLFRIFCRIGQVEITHGLFIEVKICTPLSQSILIGFLTSSAVTDRLNSRLKFKVNFNISMSMALADAFCGLFKERIFCVSGSVTSKNKPSLIVAFWT